MDLRNQRICVTGGAGFLGGYVLERLAARGSRDVFVPRIEDYDLTRAEDIRRMYDAARPDVVIHLAAILGGIGAHARHPGRFFYQNLMMGLQLIEEARLRGVRKFVAIGTACAYPKDPPVPFREESLWDGYPDETTAPYGLAKKMLLVQSRAYRAEYGFNSIFLMPCNLYGPRDNFRPDSSHVVPALIRRCIESRDAGAAEVVVWGSGAASREFIFARDAAEGIVLATERYDASDPVNLGSGREIRIRDLVGLIARLTRFEGRIAWDATKPDGQPRRCLDTSRAEREFGFRAATDFEAGLRETIEWYETERRRRA
jgi:GDP-L-fucose synthase